MIHRIEQAEAQLSVGVIGRNRAEVGGLVQLAFKMYNDAKNCEESNLPENYVRPSEGDQPPGQPGPRGSPTPHTPPSHNVRSPSPFH